MERTWRKAWKMLLACLLCIAMLMPSATVFEATENEVTYYSKEELFSVMRKALLPREKVDIKFAIKTCQLLK